MSQSLNDFKKQKIKYEIWISDTQQEKFKSKMKLAILSLDDREWVIRDESESNDIVGQIVRLDRRDRELGDKETTEDPGWKRYEKLWQEHPELQNKVFIFLAVGGKKKPNPEDSYLAPERYHEMPDIEKIKEKGGYRFSGPHTAGSIFRHETYHYNSGEKSNSEYEADTGGFESIVRAWETKQTTGRTDGYPIVFITAEGITVTKNTSQLSPKQSV